MKNSIKIIVTLFIAALSMVSCSKESFENVESDIDTQTIIGDPQKSSVPTISTRSAAQTIYKLKVTFNRIHCNSVSDGWLGSRDGEEIYGGLGFIIYGNTNSAQSPYLWSRLRSQAQSIKAGQDIWINQSHTFLIYDYALQTARLFWTGNVTEKDDKSADDDSLGNPNIIPNGRVAWLGIPINNLQLNRPVQDKYTFGKGGSFYTAHLTLTLLPN